MNGCGALLDVRAPATVGSRPCGQRRCRLAHVPLSDLDAGLVARFADWELDRFWEKHEGPWRWADLLEWQDLGVLELGGYRLVLPIDREDLPNVSLVRALPAPDGETLVLLLLDPSARQRVGGDPTDARFWDGRLVICCRVANSDVWVAVVFHEWYLTRGPLVPASLLARP